MRVQGCQIYYIKIISLIVVGLVLTQMGHAQEATGDIRISGVNAENFPEITVDLQIVDGLNIPLVNVANGDLQVREDGNEVATELHALREISDGNGLRVHFVMDVGLKVTNFGSSENVLLNNGRAPIIEFVQTAMIENHDDVSVTAVERTGANRLVNYSGDGAEILGVLEGYVPPSSVAFPTPVDGTPVPVPAGSYSDPFSTLEDILVEMRAETDSLARPQVIILISPELEITSGNANVAETAREAGIPIYTVMTNPAISQSTLQSVASTSGGRFVNYVSDSQELGGVYDEITSRRTLYQLTYRSRVNQSGTHQVEVLLPTPAGGTLSALGTFDIEVAPPRVIIEAPLAGEQILRTADNFDADPAMVLPTSYTVVAMVVFPDGYERNLVTGELRVNGTTVGNVVRNPETRIQLPWDIARLGTTEVTLEVAVQDELGLSASNAPIIVSLELDIPEASPEESVGLTEIITVVQELIPEATVIPCLSPEPLCGAIERPVRSNVTSFISIGIAMLSLIFAMFVWFNRGKVVAAGGRMGGAVTNFVERVTGRRVQATPKAYLVVLEGDQNVGRTLEVYGDTPLGRSKQFAELLFQQNDDNSPISRLHATIIDEETHFVVRDEDSANGTFLNGVRLTPLQDEELHDGDELELAQVERGGTKLLFQVAEKRGSGVPDSARITNLSLEVGRFEDTLATDFDDDEDDF